MAGKIFINYRRVESLKDAQHLKTLFDKIFGAHRVFLDLRGIDGGANWLQTLERQVTASAAMVVLIGKGWANLRDEHGNRRLDDPNDFARFEISQALLRHVPVIPVAVDWAAMPDASQLPANLMPLSLLQAMPLRGESFTDDAQKIAEKLKAVLAQRQPGVPVRVAGIGLAAASAIGIVTGPMVLDRLGLPFPGVRLPGGDPQLQAELTAAQNRIITAENAVRVAGQRLAEAERAAKAARDAQEFFAAQSAAAEKERDEARKDAASARTALDVALRDVSTVKQRADDAQRAAKAAQDIQQSLSEQVVAARKERDEARSAAAAATAKPADLEKRRVPDKSSGPSIPPMPLPGPPVILEAPSQHGNGSSSPAAATPPRAEQVPRACSAPWEALGMSQAAWVRWGKPILPQCVNADRAER